MSNNIVNNLVDIYYGAFKDKIGTLEITVDNMEELIKSAAEVVEGIEQPLQTRRYLVKDLVCKAVAESEEGYEKNRFLLVIDSWNKWTEELRAHGGINFRDQ